MAMEECFQRCLLGRLTRSFRSMQEKLQGDRARPVLTSGTGSEMWSASI